jgi:hypothetical protein
VQGNLHAGFGSEAVGKGPARRHLANGLPILMTGLWFRISTTGRVPFLSGRYRWFMRQPYLAPEMSGSFLLFAERLTNGEWQQESPEDLSRLLVNAFLEDLRRAYRWWPWQVWRKWRMTYPVLLLDNISATNGGSRLLELINYVRNQTGLFDPLLVITASQDVPDEDSNGPRFDAAHAAEGYRSWQYHLRNDRRARRDTTWFLPIRIPEIQILDREAKDMNSRWLGIDGDLLTGKQARAPWWASRTLRTLALACVLIAVVAVAAQWTTSGDIHRFAVVVAYTAAAVCAVAALAALLPGLFAATRKIFARASESKRLARPSTQLLGEQTAIAALRHRIREAKEGRLSLVQIPPQEEPAAVRTLPVTIYLESGTNADEVEHAVREVLDGFGLAVTHSEPPIIGSWFKGMLGRSKKALTSDAATDLMARLERALEMPTLHSPQAQIDSAQGDAVAKLITALAPESNALIQIGSVFLLKVDGVVTCRNLSQRELAFLERNPRVLGSPRDVLAVLEKQAQSARMPDEVMIEGGAARLTVCRPDDRGQVSLTIWVGSGPTISYQVGFGSPNGQAPMSTGVIYVQADQDGKAVLRDHGLTIVIKRTADPAKEVELIVTSTDGRTTSYELNFAHGGPADGPDSNDT